MANDDPTPSRTDLDLIKTLLDPEGISQNSLRRLRELSRPASARRIRTALESEIAARERQAEGREERRHRVHDALERYGPGSYEFRAAIAASTGDSVTQGEDRDALRHHRAVLVAWIDRERLLSRAEQYLEYRRLEFAYREVSRLVQTGDFDAAARLRETIDALYPRVKFDRDVESARLRLNQERLVREAAQLEATMLAEVRALQVALRAVPFMLAPREQTLLSPADLLLCLTWANGVGDGSGGVSLEHLVHKVGYDDADRLVSARQAELFVAAYYRELGLEVEDVSVTQIAPENDGRWKDFDLLVDGHPVDVKNARLLNGRHYAEHCVPRFKLARGTNDHVRIVGVLSRDCPASEIVGGYVPCLLLGEVTVTVIRGVYRWMRARFGQVIGLDGMWKPGFQPGWAFEYSDDSYRERQTALAHMDGVLDRFFTTAVPFQEEFVWLLPLSRTEAFTTKVALSELEAGILHDLRDLRNATGATRPALYVYVVAKVLEALASSADEATIVALKRLLLHPRTRDDYWPEPLGLHDPQFMIQALFQILSEVCAEVRKSGLRFTAFRLVHPAILVGVLDSGQTQTIYAYCGGRQLKTGNVCGNSPLYLGRHTICPECRHLVCDQCGFCADNCKCCRPRQLKWSQR